MPPKNGMVTEQLDRVEESRSTSYFPTPLHQNHRKDIEKENEDIKKRERSIKKRECQPSCRDPLSRSEGRALQRAPGMIPPSAKEGHCHTSCLRMPSPGGYPARLPITQGESTTSNATVCARRITPCLKDLRWWHHRWWRRSPAVLPVASRPCSGRA